MTGSLPSHDAPSGARPAEPGQGSVWAWTFLLAISAAMVSGLVQAGWAGWRVMRGLIAWEGPNYLWMGALAYSVLFGIAATITLVIGLVARRIWPRFNVRRIIAATVLFLSGFSLILLAARLHPAAQFIVAAGLAFRASAPVGRLRFGTLARATLLLSGLVAASGFGGALWRTVAERRARGQLAAAPEDAPNVLLVILDTVRAASLSLYGYKRETTPNLERWAADGTTFDYAISTAPWTLPSHGGMFTGRDANELSSSWLEPLDQTYPTLAEVLKRRGYETAAFIANTYYTGHDSGLDRGFIIYEDYLTTTKQILWSAMPAQTELGKALIWSQTWRDRIEALKRFDLTTQPLRIADRKSATKVTDQFLDWQSQSEKRPFFAFLNYFDAHEVYQPPRGYRRLFSPKPTKADLYDSCVRYIDDEIDRLFRTLAQRGVLDRTIVIVASDHGEYLGEHGMWGHGKGMHLEVLRVPLMIRYPPRIPAGRRVPDVVSLRDLPATVVELANLANPGFPGTSLSRFVGARSTVGPEFARARTTLLQDARLPLTQQRATESVFTNDLHWIMTPEGEDRLFAYRSDRREQTNLARQPEFAERLDSIRALASGSIGGSARPSSNGGSR